MAKGKNNKSFFSSLQRLEAYKDGATIQIAAVDSRWVHDYQKWLTNESGFSQSTSAIYSCTLRCALKQTVKDKIIATNPAEAVKSISIPETNKPTLTLEATVGKL